MLKVKILKKNLGRKIICSDKVLNINNQYKNNEDNNYNVDGFGSPTVEKKTVYNFFFNFLGFF